MHLRGSLRGRAKLVMIHQAYRFNGKHFSNPRIMNGKQIVSIALLAALRQVRRTSENYRILVVEIDHNELVVNDLPRPPR